MRQVEPRAYLSQRGNVGTRFRDGPYMEKRRQQRNALLTKPIGQPMQSDGLETSVGNVQTDNAQPPGLAKAICICFDVLENSGASVMK